MKIRLFFIALVAWLGLGAQTSKNDTLRIMKYSGRAEKAAMQWQYELRSKLTDLLNLNDLIQNRENIDFNAVTITSENKGNYMVQEIELNTTFSRRMRILLTLPVHNDGLNPAVVCIHGHGGNLSSVYDKTSIYKGFATELAEKGFVTISCTVSQHNVYEPNQTLMGERVWDLMRCVDFLETLPVVDKQRMGCAGLSLGGEMAMWLGALDQRVTATLSSGFLTNMDQMEQNHCMCWKFPGLRMLADFADIYSLIAPRPLDCQNGLKEPSDQFYVPLARSAFMEIQQIYMDYKRPENLTLNVHKGAHEIDLPGLLYFFEKNLY